MDVIKVSFDLTNGFTIIAHWLVVTISIIVVVVFLLLRWKYFRNSYSEFEINEAEIGIGNHKIKIKPNDQDLQIAYQLWVELSTRKIGLAIDTRNDVIVELYNSWYDFFRIGRDLIKAIPVRKVRANKSTRELIDLSFKILNETMRPHLTQWQARFRCWYESEKVNDKTSFPQDIQKLFPEYNELKKDMAAVNKVLISYKGMLEQLISIK